jgi:hypothetical protein
MVDISMLPVGVVHHRRQLLQEFMFQMCQQCMGAEAGKGPWFVTSKVASTGPRCDMDFTQLPLPKAQTEEHKPAALSHPSRWSVLCLVVIVGCSHFTTVLLQGMSRAAVTSTGPRWNKLKWPRVDAVKCPERGV